MYDFLIARRSVDSPQNHVGRVLWRRFSLAAVLGSEELTLSQRLMLLSAARQPSLDTLALWNFFVKSGYPLLLLLPAGDHLLGS